MKLRFFWFLILVTTTLPIVSLDFYSDIPSDELCHLLVEQLSPDEALAQTLMFGYKGDLPNKEINDWIGNIGIGGIKIFGWNAQNLQNLTDSISYFQTLAREAPLKIPLLVATDQEGGWVKHIKGEASDTPGNMSLGATGIPEDSYRTGMIIGKELSLLGINMNFAPNIDVLLNSKSHVIGPRAFSQDPHLTALLGLAFYKGQKESGVITTAKHFPGHGNTEADSHGTLPLLDVSQEELENRDFIPYKLLISESVPAVMIGHLGFPQIMEKVVPASSSRIFITDILKEEMGFKGIVITDDMFMHGSRYDNKSLAEVCEDSLRAGSDLLLVSQDTAEHNRIWNHLSRLVNSDETFRKRVEDAASRIIRIKLDYLKREDGVALLPDYKQIRDKISSDESRRFFLDQASRGISMVKQGSLPLSKDSKLLLAGNYKDFFNCGLERFTEAEYLSVPFDPTSQEIQKTAREIIKKTKETGYCLFALATDNDLEILGHLKEIEDKLCIFSVLSPYLVERMTISPDAVIVCYGTSKETWKAGFAVIRGDFEAVGEIPIKLNGWEDVLGKND